MRALVQERGRSARSSPLQPPMASTSQTGIPTRTTGPATLRDGILEAASCSRRSTTSTTWAGFSAGRRRCTRSAAISAVSMWMWTTQRSRCGRVSSTGGRVPVHLQQDYVRRPSGPPPRVGHGDMALCISTCSHRASGRWDADAQCVIDENLAATIDRNDLFLAEMRHFLACLDGRETPRSPACRGREESRRGAGRTSLAVVGRRGARRLSGRCHARPDDALDNLSAKEAHTNVRRRVLHEVLRPSPERAARENSRDPAAARDALESFRSREPVVYNIETTNACNMRCAMCPRTTMMTRQHRDHGAGALREDRRPAEARSPRRRGAAGSGSSPRSTASTTAT